MGFYPENTLPNWKSFACKIYLYFGTECASHKLGPSLKITELGGYMKKRRSESSLKDAMREKSSSGKASRVKGRLTDKDTKKAS